MKGARNQPKRRRIAHNGKKRIVDRERRLLVVAIDSDHSSANLLVVANAKDVKRLPQIGEKVVEVDVSKNIETVFGRDKYLIPKHAKGGAVEVYGKPMRVQSYEPVNVDGRWTIRYELKDQDGNLLSFFEDQV